MKSYKNHQNRNKNHRFLTITSLVLLIALGVYFGKKEYDKYLLNKRFAEVEKALNEVSVNLNKGGEIAMTELRKVSEILDK